MIGRIRRLHGRQNKSEREIARITGLSRNTVAKWLHGEVDGPPKYRRSGQRNKLTVFHEALMQALKADARRPRHERRTAKALYAEIKRAGYEGGYTRVTDFIREWRQAQGQGAAMNAFVPLAFELGEAYQFDWSEEGLVVGGIYYRAQVSHMKLCASRAFWLVAYPSQGHEMHITRLALADERVQLNDAGQVELKLKTPWRDGTTHLVMSPLEFLQRLAALVPRPRLHLIRFHGVLAPNAKLRSLVVPQGPPKDEQAAGVAASGVQCEAQTVQVGPARISWARLLKRVFDIDMQRCPNCGAGELKIIAAILERPVIEKILSHLGLDPQPPPKGRVSEAGPHFAA